MIPRPRAILGLAALATYLLAQEPSDAIKVDVDVVNVLCTVHDRHGVLVNTLNKEDFQVFEDGRPQDIRYFAREANTPLTVALLVDVSGSVQSFVQDEKEAVAKFFEQVLRPDDDALLVGFSSTIILWQDLTGSTAKLRAALQKLKSVPFRGLPPLDQPMPSTLLYKGVQETALAKLKQLPGRKVMVIISDGLDNGSPVPIEAALQAVQMTNTIVYGICFESGFSGCSFLKQLSEPTGGRTFRVRKIPIDRIFEIIEAETRSQYAIGFVSPNSAHDGKYHKLHIRLSAKNLAVEARKGYYALPPESK